MSPLLVLVVAVILAPFEIGALITLTPGNGSRIEAIVPASSQETVLVTNLPANTEYVIVQTHSVLYNVTLSYGTTAKASESTTGTSVGLILSKASKPLTSNLYIINSHNVSVEVLVAFESYGASAPIPGGCSMVLPIQYAPFLPTVFTPNLVELDIPLGSWPLNSPAPPCERAPLQYDIYELYLPDHDFSTTSAFDSLRKMIDVKAIEANGRKVNYFGTPMSKIKFANYAGTGRIVVVIARTLTDSAAYVPSLSYGCNVFSMDESDTCQILGSIGSKLLSAFLIFVGLFLTFFGHRFYKSQLFLLGFAVTSLIFYVVLLQFVDVPSSVAGLTSVCVGAIGGALWLTIWARWGAPIGPVFVAAFVQGILLASILFYSPLGDMELLKENTASWLVFFCIVLVVPLAMISYAHMTSILWSTIVGSYIFIVPVDHYVGSSLKFIILNTLRRATDESFGSSITSPPFSTPDIILTTVWVSLIVAGTAFQCWRERGRAPFPPAPTWPSRRPTTAASTDYGPTEATHLLS